MRLQLLVILWFAITAWSGHADASAIAHCHTHSAQSDAVNITNASPVPVTTVLSATRDHKALRAQKTTLQTWSQSIAPAHLDLPVSIIAPSNENMHGHTTDPASRSHSCCDEQGSDQQNSPHQCGSDCAGCAICQGCGTLHSAAMPALWQMTPAITQQKIQHLAYSYLNLQPATQERPPKR